MSKLAIVESEPLPVDPLAELIAERDRLEGEHRRLAAARARLASVADDENDALAEIGRIGAREVEAFRAWAAAGGADPAPELLTKERKIAAEKLAVGQAKAVGAERAIAGIDCEQAEIHRQAIGFAQKIEALIFDRLEAEYRSEADAIAAAIQELRRRAATLGGLTEALLSVARNLQGQGDAEGARVFYQRAERMPEVDLRETGPTGVEIEQAATLWRGKVKAMRMGKLTEGGR